MLGLRLFSLIKNPVILVVVVLPWVPATQVVSNKEVKIPSSWLYSIKGKPKARSLINSGWVSLNALE